MKILQNLKSNKGITLVALVVTIVVLLILAGVSLNLVLGENGLIAKARDARDATKQDAENTQDALNSLYDEMEAAINGGTSKVGTKFETTGTIDGGEARASNPTIPAGYTPINTEDAKWDAEGGPEYNKGLVITDEIDADGNSIGNEWVWVPVATPSVMYETASPAIELTGGTTNALSGVEVEKYTKSGIISGSSDSTRGLPNDTSSYREVDIVVGSDGTSYDAVEANRATAGFTKTVDGTTTTMTLEEMAKTMVDEYETMIASIEKYKGFYIGRYELTENGVKAGVTLTDGNWYQLYANCKNLSVSQDAMTRMVWGAQWDVTCNWLAEAGYSITDSSSWGNYSNSTGNAAVTKEDGTKAYGTKQNTGYSENWKANNIYDFAGNYDEWSQEADNTWYRANRGGGYYYSSSFNYPASYRSIDAPAYPDSTHTSRPTLIVQP